ncbi:nucleoside-triphosphatase [Streptomyces sp. MspMP-M5]|uniref:nucleoside-triphosphatase n=1 Tax=unclassified Streptomyces TaxID=2593676 RepID=UPI002D21C2B5|nr:nucleoside-triphosphatase [Streptomyces sp. MspMP-M5]
MPDGRPGAGVARRWAAGPSAATEPVPETLVLIDELGRMELVCTAFQDAVRCPFESDIDIVATVHAKSDPFTDALKRRAGIALVPVTRANRPRHTANAPLFRCGPGKVTRWKSAVRAFRLPSRAWLRCRG